MGPRHRLVHCFLQCGVGVQCNNGTHSGLLPYDETDGGLNRDPVTSMTYKSAVLDLQPPASSHSSFDPAATKELCMPDGVEFMRGRKEACPVPKFHSFVITREDGSQKYGGCLRYYAEVQDETILSSMQTLYEMYKEQVRCEKEPRSTFPDGVTEKPKNVPSSSSIETDIGTLYMSKCIAMVLERPYVTFVKQYLLQLLEYIQKEDRELSVESYVHNLLYEVMCPAPGRILKVTAPYSILQIAMPGMTLPLFDYSLDELFELVTPTSLVDLYTCLMLEHQIMLISKDNQRLMLVAESVKTLLFPFQWNHVYVPIVPTAYMHLIEAPVPFLMGLGHHALQEQADICVLHIDSNKITLPEDLPLLPFRDELIQSITAMLAKRTPTDAFSLLKFNTFSPPESPQTPSPTSPHLPLSFAQRRINRPPKLRMVRHSNSLSADDSKYSEEDRSIQMYERNLEIRHIFLDNLCKIFQNYDKFIIYPPDRESWDNNRDNMDNFERDVFLCDQPPQNLTFLSRCLETHVFSSYIDSKILTSFNEHSERVTLFDDRIEHVRKMTTAEIKSPLCSEVRRSPNPNSGYLDIMCHPPQPRGTSVGAVGHFPILRSDLLVETTSEKNLDVMSRKMLRQKSLKEAKAIFEHANLPSPTSFSHTNDSFDRMMKAHADFTNQLLKDCKNKINRLLVLKMGPEAQGLGYDYIIRDVEENSMVGAICDLVERVWSHGLVIREGKSALWCALRKHLDKFKAKNPQYSPSSTGSTSEDESIDEMHAPRTSGVFFRRTSSLTPILPPNIPPAEQLYTDIINIKNLRMIRTDTGRARAWIRLSIEKQCLQQNLELLTCDSGSLSRRYKDYAFLRDEEKVVPFIKYLYTLSAVPFLCFTASFPNISIHYKVYIVNGNKFNAQSTANPWILLSGENGDPKFYSLPIGKPVVSIVTRNLGELRSLRVGHDNTGLSPGWCLDHILVENMMNGHCTVFRCGKWLSRNDGDGSIERLLIGERVHREEYRAHRINNERSPPKPAPPPIDGTVMGQERLATAINSLVRHRCRAHESEGTLISLLCGTNGLVPALQKLLQCGLKPTSRFNRSNVFVWDFVYKVYLEVSEVSTCHPDQPAIQSFVKCIELIQRSSNSVGLDGKFLTLVCLGIRERMLHRWFYMFSQSLAASKFYDTTSVFKQDAMIDEIMGLLKILEDLNIPIDVSLIQQIDR